VPRPGRGEPGATVAKSRRGLMRPTTVTGPGVADNGEKALKTVFYVEVLIYCSKLEFKNFKI
jgi:hypothetical protein